MVDINKQVGLDAATAINQGLKGHRVLFLPCDIIVYEQQAQVFRQGFEWAGRFDFFAANAGIAENEN